MKIKVEVWIFTIIGLLIITGCQSSYNWSVLQKTVKNDQRIALGNYQDYWLDWSGDSTKIIGLAIEEKFGVHCLDLNKINFGKKQDLFLPELEDSNEDPIIWEAPLKTKPTNQASPCWSKKNDFIGYVENNSNFTESEVCLYNLKTKKMQILSCKEIGLVKGIDFAWTKAVLAIYGEKGVMVYNPLTQKTELFLNLENPVELVRWFPKDGALLLIMNNKGFRLDLGDKDSLIPKIFLNQKPNSCCFVPNKKELILSRSDKGLLTYNYETKKYRKITSGYDYQPRVSPNGKWVSFISEGPVVGGFIIRLN